MANLTNKWRTIPDNVAEIMMTNNWTSGTLSGGPKDTIFKKAGRNLAWIVEWAYNFGVRNPGNFIASLIPWKVGEAAQQVLAQNSWPLIDNGSQYSDEYKNWKKTWEILWGLAMLSSVWANSSPTAAQRTWTEATTNRLPYTEARPISAEWLLRQRLTNVRGPRTPLKYETLSDWDAVGDVLDQALRNWGVDVLNWDVQANPYKTIEALYRGWMEIDDIESLAPVYWNRAIDELTPIASNIQQLRDMASDIVNQWVTEVRLQSVQEILDNSQTYKPAQIAGILEWLANSNVNFEDPQVLKLTKELINRYNASKKK